MKLAELRLRSLTNINFVFTAPPNKSLDASGGSASRNKLGAAQGALICAAASTLTLRSVSEPGAVATGSKIQLCRDHAPVFLSPAKAGFENQRGFDPRATLAALAHPGLLSVAAPRLIDADIRIDSCLSWRYHFRRNPTNRDVSGGSVFRNKLGAAQGALIRPVEIVKLISRGQLNRWVARCVRTGSGSDRIIGSTLSHSVSVSVGRSRAWIFRRRDPRVTLAALAHPGLLSAAAPRLVDYESQVERTIRSFCFILWRNPTTRWTRSAGSVFLNCHPVASTTPRGLPAWRPRSAPGTDFFMIAAAAQL